MRTDELSSAPRDANDDRRNIFHIDEGVEIFRPGQFERWTTLSVTCATLPPIFSPDPKCNSTDFPVLP